MALKLIRAPKPRASWNANHIVPYPLWIRDLANGCCYMFHLPPTDVKKSRKYNWPTVGVGGVLAKPVEGTSGEPYVVSMKIPLLVETNYAGYEYYLPEGAYDTAGTRMLAKSHTGRSAGEILLANKGQYMNHLDDALQSFLIKFETIMSHKLRILMASAEVDNAPTNTSIEDGSFDFNYGTNLTEAYNVVCESMDIDYHQRHHINNLPTYVDITLNFKQR